MVSVILALAIAPEVAQCLSAEQANRAGLEEETLEARYSPALSVWPDDEAAVYEAWQGFTQPLQRMEGTVSLAAYFAADGTVDLVVVNGNDEKARKVCAALGAMGSYTWPLQAREPFRQCGTVVATSASPNDFRLTVRAPAEAVCVGMPIPVTVVFENAGPTSHRLWMPKDGTLKDDISLFLVVDDDPQPQQLIGPTISGPFIVDRMSIDPGRAVPGTVDLAPYLLPTSQKLGSTPGTYELYASVLKQGDGSTWTGSVWSKPFTVEVRVCD